MSQENENDFELNENENEDEDEEEEEEEEDDDNDENDDNEDNDDNEEVEPNENDEDIPINEYKTKFSNEMRSEYIKKFHPEELHKPFDEIYKLSHITRDERGIINDANHKTYPILSKYEKTKIIGLRVSQLNKGAQPYYISKRKIIDTNVIAEKELQDKLLPFIIMRPIPNSPSEYWKISDLELI
jgi:DNA-directed RNA polymerase subunit K/omega